MQKDLLSRSHLTTTRAHAVSSDDHREGLGVGLFFGGAFEVRAVDECGDGEVGNKGEDLEPGHPSIVR